MCIRMRTANVISQRKIERTLRHFLLRSDVKLDEIARRKERLSVLDFGCGDFFYLPAFLNFFKSLRQGMRTTILGIDADISCQLVIANLYETPIHSDPFRLSDAHDAEHLIEISRIPYFDIITIFNPGAAMNAGEEHYLFAPLSQAFKCLLAEDGLLLVITSENQGGISVSAESVRRQLVSSCYRLVVDEPNVVENLDDASAAAERLGLTLRPRVVFNAHGFVARA